MTISVDATRSNTLDDGSVYDSITIFNHAVPSGDFAAVIAIVTMNHSGSRNITDFSWGAQSLSPIVVKPWDFDAGVEIWGILQADFPGSTANMVATLNDLTSAIAIATMSVSGMYQSLEEFEGDSDDLFMETDPDFITYNSSPNIGDLTVIGAVGNRASNVVNTTVNIYNQTAVLNNAWTDDVRRTAIGYKIADESSETVAARFSTSPVDGWMHAAYAALRAVNTTQPIWIN